MPELPEVETTRRGIAPHICGQKITKIEIRNHRLRWPIPQKIANLLPGQTLNDLRRRGKYLIFQLDDCWLLLHLGMSGSLRILKKPSPPQKHDHVDILFANGNTLRFTDPRRFGALLYLEDAPDEHKLLAHLGPEPLSSDFNSEYLLQKARKRTAPIKSFIMDSKIVVGVGNIYATEALFKAGIYPKKPAGKVSQEKMAALVKAIKDTLHHAIQKGGTTLKDFTQSDGAPGYFRIELQVYGKANEPCPRCHTPLQNMRIAQRSTVYCKQCQHK